MKPCGHAAHVDSVDMLRSPQSLAQAFGLHTCPQGRRRFGEIIDDETTGDLPAGPALS